MKIAKIETKMLANVVDVVASATFFSQTL